MRIRLIVCVLTIPMAVSIPPTPAFAAEPDALAISANIQARHLPFGTILDPV